MEDEIYNILRRTPLPEMIHGFYTKTFDNDQGYRAWVVDNGWTTHEFVKEWRKYEDFI